MTATPSSTLLPSSREPGQTLLFSVLGRFCVRLGIQKKNVWAVAAVIIYLVTVIVISHYHEVWRDEGRAYSIAAEATSLRDLFGRLNDEGHPALWYLMMYGALHIVRTPLVINVLAIAVAVAAVWIFLIRSPFPIWQRLLFILGFFPIYQYSVVARNYGIAMLLLFCFAACYGERFKRPLIVSCIVFLLAQTNAYGLFMAAAIGVTLAIQTLVRGACSNRRICEFTFQGTWLLGLVTIFAGCLISLITITPDEFTKGIHPPGPMTRLFSDNWSKAVDEPLRFFGAGFGLEDLKTVRDRQLGTYLLWAATACLLRRPSALLIFVMGYVCMGIVATSIYHAFPWHQGCVYLLWVTAYWIAYLPSYRLRKPNAPWHQIVDRAYRVVSGAIFTMLLLLQLPPAVKRIEFDHKYEISSVKRFGEYLRSHPQYRDAIVIGEPDMFMEALPYYAKNAIFNPRESRFKGYGDFNRKVNRERLTLDELLGEARSVRDSKHKPVVIALQYRLKPDGPYEIRTDTGSLHYSRQSYEQFVSSTIKVSEFRGSVENNEDFDLFALK